ncbi:MAG: 3-hydroxyacyl-[acyl-carrier-protein] dehydratase FabZ [Nitrospirae bacterium CG_4_10_14_0_8_um_filter_41_23]|nr:3-hydroxyacyl-ACP dehydratase FabZ [Nitrospirota bacterium]OIP60220.1 MAG: 3-hydroxyacyl-[acyl-carrier-protein] dehydratase FabZ [Nitrospirae bacterium CG2_30_41_42]PIQ94628.1 MAG: 3-hydroxyacyl-[acyl-carrier-protein] dehydratase FabZ [Nitrospirae bacterium CG11_big_fil_rev_8_21_14_0_20_41_14]PIV44417.1 MAG: 3-hydroxyacyl-[acyl-carrier-protein] dehydratase FabZ [Nitrospirae bacterium CG02_land_8_20_14_3_00_41_53]PIW88354.1 MAG: 3-hydroxyacyl-[acyl-carrier-protein] dehydratase FabZ [Nitrospir
MMDIKEIQKLLPHRYPFLLVDRIIDIEPGIKAVGIKNVTINEGFFQGHFPGHPIMPGVLIIEALAQVAGILAFRPGASDGRSVYFMSIEKAKFRKPVVPGDQLRLEISILQQRGNVWKFSGNAVVEEKVVAEAEFTAMLTDRADREI